MPSIVLSRWYAFLLRSGGRKDKETWLQETAKRWQLAGVGGVPGWRGVFAERNGECTLLPSIVSTIKQEVRCRLTSHDPRWIGLAALQGIPAVWQCDVRLQEAGRKHGHEIFESP